MIFIPPPKGKSQVTATHAGSLRPSGHGSGLSGKELVSTGKPSVALPRRPPGARSMTLLRVANPLSTQALRVQCFTRTMELKVVTDPKAL